MATSVFVFVSVRLNGSRLVTGVLRGFDPFMNLVIDEAVEECKTGEKNHIGMVVCVICLFVCRNTSLVRSQVHSSKKEHSLELLTVLFRFQFHFLTTYFLIHLCISVIY